MAVGFGSRRWWKLSFSFSLCVYLTKLGEAAKVLYLLQNTKDWNLFSWAPMVQIGSGRNLFPQPRSGISPTPPTHHHQSTALIFMPHVDIFGKVYSVHFLETAQVYAQSTTSLSSTWTLLDLSPRLSVFAPTLWCIVCITLLSWFSSQVNVSFGHRRYCCSTTFSQVTFPLNWDLSPIYRLCICSQINCLALFLLN